MDLTKLSPKEIDNIINFEFLIVLISHIFLWIAVQFERYLIAYLIIAFWILFYLLAVSGSLYLKILSTKNDNVYNKDFVIATFLDTNEWFFIPTICMFMGVTFTLAIRFLCFNFQIGFVTITKMENKC